MRLGAVHYKILVALTIWIIINYLETRLSVLALSRRDKHSKLNVLLPSDVRKKMASEVKKLSELHSASIKLVFEGAFSNWCLPESCFCNQVLAYCCGDHIFSPLHFSHCGQRDGGSNLLGHLLTYMDIFSTKITRPDLWMPSCMYSASCSRSHNREPWRVTLLSAATIDCACVGLRYIEEAPTTVCKPTSIDHHAHRWNGVRAVQWRMCNCVTTSQKATIATICALHLTSRRQKAQSCRSRLSITHTLQWFSTLSRKCHHNWCIFFLSWHIIET